ncbi:MAG: PKD domain-containing protein, partial [Pseudomonadota bacterium]
GVPLDPVAISDQPLGVNATFSDPAGASDQPYTCAVDYDDGTGMHAGAVSGTTCIGPNHTYAEPGVYNVTVYVTDKDGGAGSRSADLPIVVYDPDGGFVAAHQGGQDIGGVRAFALRHGEGRGNDDVAGMDDRSAVQVVHLENVARAAVDEGGGRGVAPARAQGKRWPLGLVRAVAGQRAARRCRCAQGGAADPVEQVQRRAPARRAFDGAL